MKRTLLMSLLIALSSNIVTANVINIDSASCGCEPGCSGELEIAKAISAIQSYEQVKADRDAVAEERVKSAYYAKKADYSKIGAIKN